MLPLTWYSCSLSQACVPPKKQPDNVQINAKVKQPLKQ